ncbi:type II toxin-antitoxin system PemK/MazF family toxin [Microterricola pindariensis]|uniref:type II toxin-antitoxin system PemK/MazF family toxin n=1 Tax=Microterricola pindariensis TaxID=478010 RepID=UPI000CECC69B|nr:type II toxin-antitoxin system PemK/MazF family toxin [Microterricola pindariensis]
MAAFTGLWSALRGALRGLPRTDGEASPGRYGREATSEVDPRTVGRVRMSYSPSTDGNPDPGEIVWTWVPYQEHDGRGKDRPVLIVAGGRGGALLAVQLTSKGHDGDPDQLALGSGPWDSSGRASWVKIDRVFRVFPSGMRREGASLDRRRFDAVASALRARYGWR